MTSQFIASAESTYRKNYWVRLYIPALAFFLLSFGKSASLYGDGQRTNVVVIMSDDQGYGDVGAHGLAVEEPHDVRAYGLAVKFGQFQHPFR